MVSHAGPVQQHSSFSKWFSSLKKTPKNSRRPPPQWLLDCLACLLKLICQFAVDPADLDLAYHDVFSWSGLADSQRKRAWPGKSRKSTVEHGKGLHIPRLTEVGVSSGRLSKQRRASPTLPDLISPSVGFQVFLSLVQGTNLIQRLINVAYTYDNLAHRWGNAGAPKHTSGV